MKGRTSLYVLSLLFASSKDANATKLAWKYGQFEKERDAEAAYPEQDKLGKDMHDYVKMFIDPKNGRTKTPYEVSNELAAEAAAEYKKEFWDKPYFTINPSLVIPDYTGDKYTTSHQCFGSPCRKYPDSAGTPYTNEWV